MVMGGKLLPGGSTPTSRWQAKPEEATGQDQPGAVTTPFDPRPFGGPSVTWSIPPAVEMVPTLVTVIVNVPPVWPMTKVPEWVLVTWRSGRLILVESDAVCVFRSPPPLTLAVLVTTGPDTVPF